MVPLISPPCLIVSIFSAYFEAELSKAHCIHTFFNENIDVM